MAELPGRDDEGLGLAEGLALLEGLGLVTGLALVCSDAPGLFVRAKLETASPWASPEVAVDRASADTLCPKAADALAGEEEAFGLAEEEDSDLEPAAAEPVAWLLAEADACGLLPMFVAARAFRTRSLTQPPMPTWPVVMPELQVITDEGICWASVTGFVPVAAAAAIVPPPTRTAATRTDASTLKLVKAEKSRDMGFLRIGVMPVR